VDPSQTEPRPCLVVEAATIGYNPAWELQKRLRDRVASGDLPGVLLLLEHPHVLTLGRRGDASDILATPEELEELGVEVHHVDRGGEVTYHGHGQLVGYPIVDIRRWSMGPLAYVRGLERLLVATLADFGIHAESDDRPTGVWVGAAKIAAIGVKISRGVTTHGFALNVDPDLTYFDRIVPCGMPEVPVTSMADLRHGPIAVDEVVPALTAQFAEMFGVAVRHATLEDLTEAGSRPIASVR
jgi:lipoate-protein ligase B